MKQIPYTAEEVDKLAKNEITKKDILKEHQKIAAVRTDYDPRVGEFVNLDDDGLRLNLGYDQTQIPRLVEKLPAERLSKAGYYGNQDLYKTPRS